MPDDITEEERATLPKQMATSYTLQHLLNQSIRDDSTTVVDNPEVCARIHSNVSLLGKFCSY